MTTTTRSRAARDRSRRRDRSRDLAGLHARPAVAGRPTTGHHRESTPPEAPLTVPLATATTDHLGAAALTLTCLAGWVGGYLATCWLYPFANCRRCHGTGKNRNPINRRTFGLCRRCDGTGRRLRVGRHVLNHLRGLHAKGTPRHKGGNR
jgi:hypothetical protein